MDDDELGRRIARLRAAARAGKPADDERTKAAIATLIVAEIDRVLIEGDAGSSCGDARRLHAAVVANEAAQFDAALSALAVLRLPEAQRPPLLDDGAPESEIGLAALARHASRLNRRRAAAGAPSSFAAGA